MRAAHEQGFDAVGIASPDGAPNAKGLLAQFLADGAHGDMHWLADSRRGDPRPPSRRLAAIRLPDIGVICPLSSTTAPISPSRISLYLTRSTAGYFMSRSQS